MAGLSDKEYLNIDQSPDKTLVSSTELLDWHWHKKGSYHNLVNHTAFDQGRFLVLFYYTIQNLDPKSEKIVGLKILNSRSEYSEILRIMVCEQLLYETDTPFDLL